jgi:hypothetical protein
MKEAVMSPNISDHWLVFVAEPQADAAVQLLAVPAHIKRDHFDRAPRVVLAAADAYRDAHPEHHVAFLASVTRWLAERHNLTWLELRVDFDEALTQLQRCAAAVVIDAAPMAAVVVGTGSEGSDPSIARHTEPIRLAIDNLLRSQRTTIC